MFVVNIGSDANDAVRCNADGTNSSPDQSNRYVD